MTITTSQNKTYTVQWIDTSAFNPNVLVMQMTDARRLPVIASEFDELTQVDKYDENEGDKTFVGFSQLILVKRIGTTVQIQMEATQ